MVFTSLAMSASANGPLMKSGPAGLLLLASLRQLEIVLEALCIVFSLRVHRNVPSGQRAMCRLTGQAETTRLSLRDKTRRVLQEMHV